MAPGEAATVQALRDGDEDAFVALVAAHHATMVHVARRFVADRATAEEVAQDAWLGFLEGLGRFEGRASLRTYLCTIVANRARTRAVRDARSTPVSALGRDAEHDGPAVSPDRFLDDDHDRWPGHWRTAPAAFAPRPESALVAHETRDVLLAAIERLPERQRAVIVLHDVHGATPAEICAVLDLGEGNRRVLLHRARTAVRAALEAYLGATVAA